MINEVLGTPCTSDLAALKDTYEKVKNRELDFEGENLVDRNGTIYSNSLPDPPNTQESTESEFYEDTLGANSNRIPTPIHNPTLNNNITKQNTNTNDYLEAPQTKKARPARQPISNNTTTYQSPVQSSIPQVIPHNNIQIENQECDMDMESDEEFAPAPVSTRNPPPPRPTTHINPPEPLRENQSTTSITYQRVKPTKYVTALLRKQGHNIQFVPNTQNPATKTNAHILPNGVPAPISAHPPVPTNNHVLPPPPTNNRIPLSEPTNNRALPSTPTSNTVLPPAPTSNPVLPPEPKSSHVPPPTPMPPTGHVPPATTLSTPSANQTSTHLTNGTGSQSAQIDISTLLQATSNSYQPFFAHTSSTSTLQALFNSAPIIPTVPTLVNQNGQIRTILLPLIDLDRLRTNQSNSNQQ